MLQLISRYRTELMGFACIWVILYHIGNIRFFNEITLIGYGGVDIFFFLSGYGLFFSSLKKDSLIAFYIKRFQRVFPTYAIIVLIAMIGYGTFSISRYLLNISTVGFWLDKGSFEWYIPSLFVFYLSFPFIIRLLTKRPYLTLVGSFIVMFLFVEIILHFKLNMLFMLFATRIPIFLIGILFGKFTFEKSYPKWITKTSLYSITFISFITLFLCIKFASPFLDSGLYWYPFIGITPGLCLCIASVLERINITYLKTILFFCGTLSLELYLSHVALFEKADVIAQYFGAPKIAVLFLSVLVVIPFSYFLSKFVVMLGRLPDYIRTYYSFCLNYLNNS